MSRRRIVRLVLVALFIGMPLLEIFVLIQVGQVIGPWWTILLLILGSVVGSWLIRREGGRAWRALTSALNSGRMPAKELADGALILIGGTLMLSPGFVTDAMGMVLILPLTRPLARRVLTQVITRRLLAGNVPGPGNRRGPGAEGSVIRGEVVGVNGSARVSAGSRHAGRDLVPRSRGSLDHHQRIRWRGSAQLTFFLRAEARWRCAGPISPPRSSSSRSLRMSSSSFSERRSSSMSQWVRAGFSFLATGSMPETLSASAPQRWHSHVAGTSASTDIVISNSCPRGHRYPTC